MARIGFVTTSDLSAFFPAESEPELTHDDAVAADFLRAAGHEVVALPWGESPPARIDLAIVRSPWDYFQTLETAGRFLEWLDQLAEETPVHNRPALVRWNLDKHYLAELGAADVPIVPTEVLEPDFPLTEEWLAEQCRARGSLVLKPCISAGARDTFLIHEPEDVTCLEACNGRVDGPIQAWRGDRAFLLQPFLGEVQERGEWSLTLIDGEYTHAVVKVPKPGNWLVQDELGGSVHSRTPTPEMIGIANHVQQVIEASSAADDEVPLYTRVDIIETTNGPLVGEVELVEPELFFKLREPHSGPCQHALQLFQQAIEKRLSNPRS